MKRELHEAVILPLEHGHLFRGLRAPPRAFLLHGPPGTGACVPQPPPSLAAAPKTA